MSSEPASSNTPENEGEPPAFFVFLADLIQLYALNDDPSVLMITSTCGARGTIALAEGTVIHAQCGTLTGEEAFNAILRWEGGEMSRRVIRRSTTTTISIELSTLLMNAYDEVMQHGVLVNDGPPLADDAASLEEHTLGHVLEHPGESVRQTLSGNTDFRHYFRLVWGENLRSELKSMEGFVSFELMDIHGKSEMRSTLVEASSSLAENMFRALKDSDAIDAHMELYLSLAASYHAFLRLPLGNHILYVVFDRDVITPAMVQFKLKQIIEKLPSSKQPGASKP